MPPAIFFITSLPANGEILRLLMTFAKILDPDDSQLRFKLFDTHIMMHQQTFEWIQYLLHFIFVFYLACNQLTLLWIVQYSMV